MTIVFDVSHVQTRRGGIGRVSLSLLQALLDTDQDNRYVLHGWSNALDVRRLKRCESPSVSLRVARLPGALKRAYWDRLRFPPLELFTGRCDLFHSADAFIPPLHRGAAIATVHDMFSLTHPQFHTRPVINRNGAMAASLRKADRVIVYSSFTRDQVLESTIIGEKKIVIVAPPLPMSFSPEESPDDAQVLLSHDLRRPYILFVGTLEPRKNILGLIGAYEALLASEDVGVDLVIVGKLGWLSGEIPASMARSNVRERIRWLRYVDDAALPALYRHASCLVYPSFVEGYGSPVAEAMACGAPVITSASSGMAEVGDGAAVLTDPRSAAELTAAMKRLLTSHSERTRLRSLGLRRAATIRAEDGAGVVRRLYAEMASR